MDLNRILIDAVRRGASDIHLMAESIPVVRIRGSLITMEGHVPLTADDLKQALRTSATPQQVEIFDTERELDYAYWLVGTARFRVNACWQRGTIALSFRPIPAIIPAMDDLRLPVVCRELALKPRGMVLVTGPTGAGKSTTLAAMIDYINATKRCKIVTIEDPIEYLHQNKKSFIIQRDLGGDTRSFASALKHVLRQDPDVILIGEMRDLETISIAMTAAETGHLVLSTLHTISSTQTVDRIIDVFPPAQQTQIRMQFSLVIEGVLSQVLLPTADGKRRTPCFEIMLGNYAIKNLIREGKTHQLMNFLQLGTQHGMQTMDQALQKLVEDGMVTMDEALKYAQKPQEMFQGIKSAKQGDSK